MKKWHVILASALAFIVAAVIGGIAFYNYYLVPKYIAPIISQVTERLKDDKVIDALYDEGKRYHDEGIITDSIYTKFVDAYNERKKNNESEARRVLEAKEKEGNNTETAETTKSANYASSKVGVEVIQVNGGEASGKSSSRYSTERTSDRIKAEDIVEAEKVIAQSEKKKTEEETPKPENDDVQKAYKKLKDNMTAQEFSTFVVIMQKLDINTLKTYISDKEGLKAYLHARLTDSEYKEIVNLGYKYVYLFME